MEASAENSPPRVAVELTNAADHDVVVSGGATAPFTTYRSTEDDLAAVPADRQYVSSEDRDGLIPESRDGCWRVRSNILIAAIGIQLGLDPGESATTEFSILAGLSTADCPRAGSYRFENEIGVFDGRAEPGSRSRRELLFEFTVERTADGGIASVAGRIRPAP